MPRRLNKQKVARPLYLSFKKKVTSHILLVHKFYKDSDYPSNHLRSAKEHITREREQKSGGERIWGGVFENQPQIEGNLASDL